MAELTNAQLTEIVIQLQNQLGTFVDYQRAQMQMMQNNIELIMGGKTRAFFLPLDPSKPRLPTNIVQGPKGEQGVPGQDAASITILGQVNSVGDLPILGHLKDSYILNNDDYTVDPPAIAGDLFVWNDQDFVWVNVGAIRGPRGFTYLPSVDANGRLTWGWIVTAQPPDVPGTDLLPNFTTQAHLTTDNPSATITETSPGNWNIDFGLLQGETGDLSTMNIDIVKELEFESTPTEVTATVTNMNLASGATNTVTFPFPVVSQTYSGIVDTEMYKAWLQNGLDIAFLKAQSNSNHRTAIDEYNFTDDQAQADITQAFNDFFPGTPAEPNDRLVDTATGFQWIWNGTEWLDITQSNLSLVTTTTPGLVKNGTALGSIIYPTPGIGQLNGYDSIMSRLSALETTPASSWNEVIFNYSSMSPTTFDLQIHKTDGSQWAYGDIFRISLNSNTYGYHPPLQVYSPSNQGTAGQQHHLYNVNGQWYTGDGAWYVYSGNVLRLSLTNIQPVGALTVPILTASQANAQATSQANPNAIVVVL
jgi:hypothetical protein